MLGKGDHHCRIGREGAERRLSQESGLALDFASNPLSCVFFCDNNYNSVLLMLTMDQIVSDTLHMHDHIKSSKRWLSFCTHFTDEKTEVQRGQISFSRSHSWEL